MRWHSLDRVIEELKTVVKGQGVQHIILMDETKTLNRNRTLELCQRIRDEKLNSTFEGWTQASTIDEVLLRLSFGIEDDDPEILKRIKQGDTFGSDKTYMAAGKSAGGVGSEKEIGSNAGRGMIATPIRLRATPPGLWNIDRVPGSKDGSDF